MLISFALTNHRSVRERVEVSLVAETKPTAESRLQMSVPSFGLEILPVLGIVGANGAGKSNVMHGLGFVSDAVGRSHVRWAPDEPPPRYPFRVRDGSNDSPSIYEVTFALDETVYEYEFQVGSGAIVYERLNVARRGPRSWANLFERFTRGGKVEIRFGRSLGGPRAAAEAATRTNSLFLSSAAQNNHDELSRVWDWLQLAFRVAGPENRAGRSRYTADRYRQADDHDKARLREFIASADLGIQDLDVREVELDEDQISFLRTVLAAADARSPDEDSFVLPKTTFQHDGDVGAIDLEDESAGTRAWFEWAGPVLFALDIGDVLVADELDAHLNSYLASQIIRSFQEPHLNRLGAQLIFNAQDPTLISNAGLARDQIYVAEKDSAGATQLTAVTDFSPRREWDVGQAYRHGRFGGLPVIDEDAFEDALLRGREDGAS